MAQRRPLASTSRSGPGDDKPPLANVPHDPPQYAKLTPLEYRAFIAGLWGAAGAAAQRRGEELVRLLGLWDQAERRCETCSRGMKRKLALAGTLLHEPRLLILDGPFSGRAADVARLLMDLLHHCVARGVAVVPISDLLEFAKRPARRIGIIQRGLPIAEGPLEVLHEQPGRAGASLGDVFLEPIREPPP